MVFQKIIHYVPTTGVVEENSGKKNFEGLFDCTHDSTSQQIWINNIPEELSRNSLHAKLDHNGKPKSAVIFGATGLVGRELVRILISKSKWKVYGIARRFDSIPIQNSNYIFISCNLLDAQETEKKLSSIIQNVTHMFWITWAAQFPLDTKQCLDQNLAMMSNALNLILPNNNTLKHVSIQTGIKHYTSFKKGENTIFDEDFPRVKDGCNFYYALEDLVKERLESKVAWSVIRPGLIIGNSNRSLYNVMGCLCVYGSICKYLNLPFTFGGSRECWEEVCIDCSDARLVAEQHIWAANDELMYGEAFNSTNGTSFSWKEVWSIIGKKLQVKVGKEMFMNDFWYAKAMNDKKKVWKEIVAKKGLVESEIEDLANWDFLDALFRCPVKLLAKRDKADRLGFRIRYKTLDSMLFWIDSMKTLNLIP
ncbi:(S)-8-oxocitronellyl enol synthase ISY1 [Euphorbia lathyris]|uniref:(S)-8-oxocitronellyl enol synthase ISY1 n=1 Tax=Euphorbia lathyris TaxID=212925 RepID=UPI003313BADC